MTQVSSRASNSSLTVAEHKSDRDSYVCLSSQHTWWCRSVRIKSILGVGVNAGDLIAEGVRAVEMAATASDLVMTIHAHPTLAESTMEAADAYFGLNTNIYTPVRGNSG
jgi:hypothetical protein